MTASVHLAKEALGWLDTHEMEDAGYWRELLAHRSTTIADNYRARLGLVVHDQILSDRDHAPAGD